MSKTKIFITGGHLTPALAVIEKIMDKKYPFDIYFVGRKYEMDGDTNVSQEFRIIKSLGITFFELHAGRLKRYISFGTILNLFKFPIGILEAFIYCLKVRPKIIVSFGGYIALPVVLAGWLMHIPVITHEQTLKIGLANRIIAFFARKVCVSWEETVTQGPKSKTVYTGLPLRKDIFLPPAKPSFDVNMALPVIYIVGGTTGSRSINTIVLPIVEELVKKFVIIHQMGSNWVDLGIKVLNQLPTGLKNNYYPTAYLDTKDHAWAINKSVILISRAGANIVAEILALGKFALLFPLRWSGGEQTKNAELLVKNGQAIILDEGITTDIKLKEIISETYLSLTKNPKKIHAFHQSDATDKFLFHIIKLMGE